jgi:hypothetical protein
MFFSPLRLYKPPFIHKQSLKIIMDSRFLHGPCSPHPTGPCGNTELTQKVITAPLSFEDLYPPKLEISTVLSGCKTINFPIPLRLNVIPIEIVDGGGYTLAIQTIFSKS